MFLRQTNFREVFLCFFRKETGKKDNAQGILIEQKISNEEVYREIGVKYFFYFNTR